MIYNVVILTIINEVILVIYYNKLLSFTTILYDYINKTNCIINI